MRARVWNAGLAALACAAVALPVLAQDKLEGPWGTVHGNLFGWSRMKPTTPLQWGTGTGAKVAFDLDVQALGLDRPAGWSSITFDKDGNIYFKTTTGTHKIGCVKPDGTKKWTAKDSDGTTDFNFGAGFNGAAPVIGELRVYGLGVNDYAGTGEGVVAAFNKTDGKLAWKKQLPDAGLWTDNNQATPVLYNGKLYVLGTDTLELTIYQVNAASGAIEWKNAFLIDGGLGPQVAFVPDIFGSGQHGLYFAVKDASIDLAMMHGFKITSTAATKMWSTPVGKLARTHAIYNPVAPGSTKGRLYVPTWNDYGATVYAYDPITGDSFDNGSDQPAGGHGFYDVCALDWDDKTIVAGGFDGRFALYTDKGDGTFKSDVVGYIGWFGEPRVLGALVKDCASDSVMVTGTNSRSDLGADHEARMIVANLTKDQHGCFDDGPLYIDDVKVWDGATLVFSDTFNTYTTGKLAPQGGWVDDNLPPSGDDTLNPAVVIVDPDSPSNKLMKLDAAGCLGGWIGAYHPLDDSSSGKAVMQWKQKRVGGYRDNFWFAFGDAPNDFNDTNGWGMGWDINGKMTPWKFDQLGDTDPGSILQKKDVWQTVTITYDYDVLEATIQIDSDVGDPIGFPAFTGLYVTGIDFQLEGTFISDLYNIAMVEYNTGSVQDHGFTLHGGPLLGMDGKIYYFHRVTRRLVALTPQTKKGDSNCDGKIDAFDIDSFVQALTDPAGWKATHTCDYVGANDTNNDGKVDAFDIDPYVGILTQSCP